MRVVVAPAEWRGAWAVPFLGMVGVASSAAFAYASSVFVGPMTAELGWSRSAFTSAFTLQTLGMLVFLPWAGRLTDRFGPRRVALSGLVPAALGLSLLGSAGHSLWLWWALCLLHAACTAMIAPPVWIACVTERFDRSRGLALALVLAGVGLAMTAWPPLAALAIQHFGWRQAFPALAIGWLVVLGPLTLLFFRGARDMALSPHPPTQVRTRVPLGPALRSRSFICILIAGSSFAMVSVGLGFHLVPILRGAGMTLTQAAGIAGVTGLFSIAGRIGTGFLLDRLPTRALAVLVFLLPVPVVLLLWHVTPALAPVAGALLGLGGGAETDVLTFVAARRFGRAGFASIFAICVALFGLFASLGPLLGSVVFDRTGSYRPFLALTIPLVVCAAIAITLVPRTPALVLEPA